MSGHKLSVTIVAAAAVVSTASFGNETDGGYLDEASLIDALNLKLNDKPGIGPTSIIDSLNEQIMSGSYKHKGLFQGGRGVMVRTPDFFSGSGTTVVPGSYWVNDIVAPNQLYPTGNPWCPHGNSDGFTDISWSKCEVSQNGPWSYATVAALLGVDGMQQLLPKFNDIQTADWGWGVFYAYDANAADKRCRNLGSLNGFDCPGMWIPYQGSPHADNNKRGAGFYDPGNPYAQGGGGGGAGCHFDVGTGKIDQTDAWSGKTNLVQDNDCQCNYAFKKDWHGWVDDWIHNTQQKAGFEWRSWLKGGKGRAPAWGLDPAICWVNNPKDMILMQNALWDRHLSWLNGEAPQWGGSALTPYWGWNEVPVSRKIAEDSKNWDAVLIKLPADLNSVNDLGSAEKAKLEQDLATWQNKGTLVPGKDKCGSRPGSYIVIARETQFKPGLYYKYFFCENWSGPQGWYRIVYHAPHGQDGGACFVEKPSDVVV
jgi:hypothetical protein